MSPRVWTYDELLSAEEAGERLKFLLFCGHTAPGSGGTGRPVLSQWWPSEFDVDSATYRTAEHYTMAEQARRTESGGIGMGRNNPAAEKPSLWRGRNLLGFALMQARAELAAT